MAYTIDSGNIQAGVLYRVFGSPATVTYNGTTYNSGDAFRGAAGVTTFTTTGSATVQEVLELAGSGAAYVPNGLDQPVYTDILQLQGMSVTFELAPEEMVVNETTRLQGFALELIDYPFYSFEITEIRL